MLSIIQELKTLFWIYWKWQPKRNREYPTNPNFSCCCHS